MKMKYKIFSGLFLLTAFILCASLLFQESVEFEYALIVPYLSSFLLVLSVLILIFAKYINSKPDRELKLKKMLLSIAITLAAFTAIFTFCAFISCYDGYTPEALYVTDKEFIQSFFPTKDIDEIKNSDDLYYKGRLEYSDFPGSSKIEVNASDKSLKYEMHYMKSLSPTLNLRYYIRKYYYTHFDPYGISENYREFTIDRIKVEVYNNAHNMFACIDKYNEHFIILIENYDNAIASQNESAEMAYGQFVVARNAVKQKTFRERPWYDVLFYLKEWNEPYEPSEYFQSE